MCKHPGELTLLLRLMVLLICLVRTNRGEAWRWQFMSKHFYPEAVYSDEGDKPQMRWRKRSTFTEIVTSYDDENETKSQRNHNGVPNPPHPSISNGSDASKTKLMLQNSSVTCKQCSEWFHFVSLKGNEVTLAELKGLEAVASEVTLGKLKDLEAVQVESSSLESALSVAMEKENKL